MKYWIWCTVSGGVTGSRSDWLKDDGKVVSFDSLEAAEQEAARLDRERNGPHAKAFFYYRPMPIKEGIW